MIFEDIKNESDEVVFLLKKSLDPLNLINGQYQRLQGTHLITKTIQKVCNENIIVCMPEVDMCIPNSEGCKHGILDFVIEKEAKKYAVEIDSANKEFSIEKLMFMNGNGYISVWIRWWYPMNIRVPQEIYLLDYTREINLQEKL